MEFISLRLCIFHILIFKSIIGYELKLDSAKDVILWKFNGYYFYTPQGEVLNELFSSTNIHFPIAVNDREIVGLWLSKHSPSRNNKLVISYTLKHALFTQGWIKLLADPGTPLLVKTNNERQLGKYWSDGKNWCDVVINIGLQTMIILEVETPEPHNYFLLDKVILGIFSNITSLNGRTLNPCLQHPHPTPTQEEMMESTTSTSTRIIPNANPQRYIVLPEERPSKSITGNSSLIIPVRESVSTKNESLMMRNTRDSSSRVSGNDLIEFQTTTTTKVVDTDSDDKWRSEIFSGNDGDVMRMTPLKPPTMKKVRLQLTNPDNNMRTTTLMDNLDVELPVSDGIISENDTESTSRSNHKNTPTLDLKCTCTCSCKTP